MALWTPEELATFDRVDELGISSLRADGSSSKQTTIWTVRVGDEAFVRSAYGPNSGWYRATQASGLGHIVVGEMEKDVSFSGEQDPSVLDAIDQAYLSKYSRFDDKADIVTPESRSLTIKLTPR
jgi:hypothetical protein